MAEVSVSQLRMTSRGCCGILWHRHSCLCQSVLIEDACTGRSAGATRVLVLPTRLVRLLQRFHIRLVAWGGFLQGGNQEMAGCRRAYLVLEDDLLGGDVAAVEVVVGAAVGT